MAWRNKKCGWRLEKRVLLFLSAVLDLLVPNLIKMKFPIVILILTPSVRSGENNNNWEIDHFKCKMYSECMEKVGRLMLDNLRKVDIL